MKCYVDMKVTAEVDPWVYCVGEENEKIKYLASSSTLNRPLPGEREAEHSNVEGYLLIDCLLIY